MEAAKQIYIKLHLDHMLFPILKNYESISQLHFLRIHHKDLKNNEG